MQEGPNLGQGDPSLSQSSRGGWLAGYELMRRLKTRVTSEIQGKSQLEMKLEPGYRLMHIDFVLPNGTSSVMTTYFHIFLSSDIKCYCAYFLWKVYFSETLTLSPSFAL